jgi:hypothetical protein
MRPRIRRRTIKSVANATIRCLATILCRWHSVANNPSYKATPLQLTYEDSSVTGINPGVGFQYTVGPDMVTKTSERHVLGIHQSISVESSWLSVLDNSDRVQSSIASAIASASLKKIINHNLLNATIFTLHHCLSSILPLPSLPRLSPIHTNLESRHLRNPLSITREKQSQLLTRAISGARIARHEERLARSLILRTATPRHREFASNVQFEVEKAKSWILCCWIASVADPEVAGAVVWYVRVDAVGGGLVGVVDRRVKFGNEQGVVLGDEPDSDAVVFEHFAQRGWR